MATKPTPATLHLRYMSTQKAAAWAAISGALLLLVTTLPPAIEVLNYRSTGPEDLGGLAVLILAEWPFFALSNAASMVSAYGFAAPLALVHMIDPTASSTAAGFLIGTITFNTLFGACCGLCVCFAYRLLRSTIKYLRAN